MITDSISLHMHLQRAQEHLAEAAQLRQLHDHWQQRGALPYTLRALPYTLRALRHDARALRRLAAAAHARARQCLGQIFTTDIEGAAA